MALDFCVLIFDSHHLVRIVVYIVMWTRTPLYWSQARNVLEINLSTSRSPLEPRTASWSKRTLSDNQKFSGNGDCQNRESQIKLKFLFISKCFFQSKKRLGTLWVRNYIQFSSNEWIKLLDIEPHKSKFWSLHRDSCRTGGQFQVNMTSQLS